MSLSIVVLAAGKGSRMKSDLPKVLHPISGLPMVYYAIKEAQILSDDITVVLYHQAQNIQRYIESEFTNINFKIQDYENFPGTGGAVMDLDVKYEKILILNGDMPLITAKSLKSLNYIDADIVMSVIELENPLGYGRVEIKDGEVEAIIEERDCTEIQKKIKMVNAGVYIFKKDLLKRYLPKLSNKNAQNEYYLTNIIKMARDDNLKIKPVLVKEDEFKGVNSRFDLANAEEIMQQRIKKRWMLEGVTMHLPSTIYIDSQVEFIGECILENGVTILGKSIIENSHIKSHSVIENAKIKNSSCGPMARVRPDSLLVDTQIGNFVEVKKSQLFGVKAGHLSYLGDAEIDEGTNIGAGTITCNYDGIKKHKTKIGKNVFIGSDTQLIAPVKVEDDVIIAAGTTVTKDIEKGSLAISRTPQKSIKDFFYKFFKNKR